MNITYDHQREFHRHERSINFEEGTPFQLERRYSHGGKQLLPHLAVAKWEHNQPIRNIELFGNILKKDGTPGENRGSINYVTPAHIGWNTRWNTNAPEWLLDLFADSPHTTPEGDNK